MRMNWLNAGGKSRRSDSKDQLRVLILGAGMLLSAAACATKTVVSSPDSAATRTSVTQASGAVTTNSQLATSVPPESSAPEQTTTTVAPTTTTTLPAAIGSTITLTGSHSKLAVTLSAYTDPLPAGQFSTPDPGSHLVGVQLRIVNTGSTAWSDSLSNGAKLVDDKNQEYQSTYLVDSVPAFNSSTVSPGDTRLGWIGFSVPDGVQPQRFTLVLDSGFADNGGQWLLGVGAPADPAPAVSVPIAGLNDSITLTGAKTLTMKVTLTAIADNATAAKYSTVKTGYRLLAVQLEFANTGTIPYSDSPTNGIKLIDSAGQTWSTTYTETGAGPGFAGSVQIPPNDARSGWVVFELPADQTAAKIQIALDSGFADIVGEWNVTG